MQNQHELLLRINELEQSLDDLHKNHEGYQQLLEQIPEPIIISDFDNQPFFCNESAYNLLGFNPETANMTDLANHLINNQSKKWNNHFLTVFNSGISDTELSLTTKEGLLLELKVNSKKIFFQGKECIVTFLKDISEQRLVEQHLRNEQQKNDLIINSIPAMIFIKDRNSRFLSVNKAFQEHTGFSQEQILNKTVFELIDNKVLATEIWNDEQEVIQSGFARRNIIEPLLSDNRKWLLTDKIPYKDSDGQIIGVLGFSVDISEHKHAEDELLRSEKMFRSLFETAPDGIILSTIDGKILSTNTAIENMLGYSSEEFKNLTSNDITPEKWRNLDQEIIVEAIQKGENVKSIEKEFFTKVKSEIPVLVNSWIIYGEDGRAEQLGSYIKDISIEKKAKKLEQFLLQREVEQLEKDLDVKTRELNLKITKLIEINALVRGVISKLEDLLEDDSSDKNGKIELIINELIGHANDGLWQQMELTFGQIHESFYQKLFTMFPNLTRNEKRLCAFLKMNLSTKDISDITHQSIRSIEVARTRLREKMKISRTISLTKFFSQI